MYAKPNLAKSSIEITIPKDGTFVRATQDGRRETIGGEFVKDFVRGNILASAAHFGGNLLRRRIGHAIGSCFDGAKPGDKVRIPIEVAIGKETIALAWELWRALSEADFTGPMAGQLPEAWLWAIPEVDAPPPQNPNDERAPEESAPPDPNPPQKASAEDAQALAAIATEKPS